MTCAWLAASFADIDRIIPLFPHTKGGEIAADAESGTTADDHPDGPRTNTDHAMRILR